MDRLLVDVFTESYGKAPREIWLDLDAANGVAYVLGLARNPRLSRALRIPTPVTSRISWPTCEGIRPGRRRDR